MLLSFVLTKGDPVSSSMNNYYAGQKDVTNPFSPCLEISNIKCA